MRVWFNDGRIRDFDFWPLIRAGENRYKELADESVSSSLMSVFGSGTPGFDFGGNHNENDCMDFDPYHIWANSTDVTERTLAAERGNWFLPFRSTGRARAPRKSVGRLRKQ